MNLYVLNFLDTMYCYYVSPIEYLSNVQFCVGIILTTYVSSSCKICKLKNNLKNIVYLWLSIKPLLKLLEALKTEKY